MFEVPVFGANRAHHLRVSITAHICRRDPLTLEVPGPQNYVTWWPIPGHQQYVK